jgi:hypothetical protein
MADNILDISILSPLKFVRDGYTPPAPYNTRYFDDFIYEDTIRDWWEQAPYAQPWQFNDHIPLQVLSNYSPHQLELYDCEGNQVSGGIFVMSYVPSSIEGIGVKVYQAAIALDDFEEGLYRFKLKSGDPILDNLKTEWFYLKEKHEDTVLLQYKHNENDHDVVFETGIEFRFRVKGGLVEYTPASRRTVFVDQPENVVQLNARSFATYKLLIGDTWGIPDWTIERINKIFDCSQVLIDGRQFVANEGAKVEANRQEEYPLAGWALEVRPAKNETKKRFIAEGDPDNDLTVAYQIDTRGFGPINQEASTNIIQIEAIE